MNLERLVAVLEAVAISGRPLSAAELHQVTGLPVPTCYRMLQMLKDQRLLADNDSNNRFVIGDRLIRIAQIARTDVDVCSLTAPVLKDACNDFGEAVFLSRFREQGVSIIHVETPADPSISYVHPGLGSRPMHACSCSKVIAAFADDGFRQLILKEPMRSYTDQTETSPERLEQEFLQIQKKGYAECVEEIEVGVSSVAAPVILDDVGAIFSVGTIGSIRRFNARHRKARGKDLIGLARTISASIQVSNSSKV